MSLEAAVHLFDPREEIAPVWRPNNVEGVSVISGGGDFGTQRRHQCQAGNAEHVRPHRPDPRLVDERLADVEGDPARFHERLA